MRQLILLLVMLLSAFVLHSQHYTPINGESHIGFKIRNFGLTVEGLISGIEGSIVFDSSALMNSTVNISAMAKSVTTGISLRDNHLRGEAYFNSNNFPAISFTSRQLTRTQSGFHAAGTLTIKGESRQIVFDFVAKPVGEKVVFKGTFQVNRRDYNLGGKSLSMQDLATVEFSITAHPSGN